MHVLDLPEACGDLPVELHELGGLEGGPQCGPGLPGGPGQVGERPRQVQQVLLPRQQRVRGPGQPGQGVSRLGTGG